MVVIDPPMFAQSEKQIVAALAAYQKLTRLGLGVLKKGGVLVQASCSTRVDDESFFDVVNKSARDTGRRLTEIERTGHPFAHPIGFNEGAYLKCLFATA
jgi:23S rRNA (cytosine1962-C5)-methyltransferase